MTQTIRVLVDFPFVCLNRFDASEMHHKFCMRIFSCSPVSGNKFVIQTRLHAIISFYLDCSWNAMQRIGSYINMFHKTNRMQCGTIKGTWDSKTKNRENIDLASRTSLNTCDRSNQFQSVDFVFGFTFFLLFNITLLSKAASIFESIL